MSLHSEISELRRLSAALGVARTSAGFENLVAGGQPGTGESPEIRQALLSTVDCLAFLNVITNRLITALSDIEIRLHQLNNAGPGAAVPR